MTQAMMSRVLYALAVVANFVLTAFAIQLGGGRVPISADWQWAVPLITAAVTGAMMFLPRVGSESISVQVDALKAQGVAKQDMLVVPKDDIEGIPT